MSGKRKAKRLSALAWLLIACLTFTSVTPTFTAFAEETTQSSENPNENSEGKESVKTEGTGETETKTSGDEEKKGTDEKSDGEESGTGKSDEDKSDTEASEDDQGDQKDEIGTGDDDPDDDKPGDPADGDKDPSDREEPEDEGEAEGENSEDPDSAGNGDDADPEEADDEDTDADADSDDDEDADNADTDAGTDEDSDSEPADEEESDEDADDAVTDAPDVLESEIQTLAAEEEIEEEEEEEIEDWLLASASDAVCRVDDEFYPSIEDALEAIAEDGGEGTITLLGPDDIDSDIDLLDNGQADIVNENIVKIEGLDVTIDLNGQTITGGDGDFTFSDDSSIGTALFYVGEGGSLTIEDSSGSGEIYSDEQTYVIAAEGGNVVINGGKISDSSSSDRTIWIRDESTLEVNGGTVNASGSSGIGINAVDSAVTITGGTINAVEAASYAVRVSGTELNITGGEFNSVGNGVYIQNSTSDSGDIAYSTAAISGGTITTNGGSGTALGVSYGSNVTVEDVTLESDYFGIAYYGSSDYEETVLTINGGTFTAPQVTTSGYHYSNIHLTVNDGYFEATGTASEETPAGGIYFPCTGIIDFNGGTLISESDGITIRDGTLNMTGGYIEANGVPEDWPDPDEQTSDNSGGYDGVGILIGQHTVDSYSDRYLTVNISGGEIYGYAYALLENDYQRANNHAYEDRIHVNISGGIFSSSGNIDEHPVDIIDEDEERSAGALDEAHITGGFFSKHVEESDYIDDGYMCIDGVSVEGKTDKTSGDNYHAVIPDKITSGNTTATLDQDTFTYDGQPHVASPSNVTMTCVASSSDADQSYDVILIEGKHYTVSYALDEEGSELIDKDDIINAGTYYVIITGTGEDAECSFDSAGGEHTKKDGLTGSISIPFYIVGASQDISYETTSVTKTTNDPPFTNELTQTVVYGEITYSSSDESVAVVDENGLVTIIGAGTTTITATAAGGEGYSAASASYTLTVTEEDDSNPEPQPAPDEDIWDLTIAVYDKNGSFASGVVIGLYNEDGDLLGTYMQDPSEEIQAGELPAGTYTVKIVTDNGYTFESNEYSVGLSSDMTYTITASNAKSTGSSGRRSSGGGGGSSGSSSSSGTVYTGSNGMTGSWIYNGMLFTFPDGTHPSNQYLIIDGEVYAFWTNGYAISREHTQYYTDEAIADQGSIPTATGTWELCGWWFKYSDGSYPHNGWAQLSYNGRSDWYYFDVDGWMETGWLNWNGNTYYLHTVWDGTRGHMYTGWNEIDGYWYYFGSDGALYRNTETPDGHTVDAEGRLIG